MEESGRVLTLERVRRSIKQRRQRKEKEREGEKRNASGGGPA